MEKSDQQKSSKSKSQNDSNGKVSRGTDQRPLKKSYVGHIRPVLGYGMTFSCTAAKSNTEKLTGSRVRPCAWQEQCTAHQSLHLKPPLAYSLLKTEAVSKC